MSATVARHLAATTHLPASKLIIGGRDISATSTGTIAHINATTGREQGQIVLGGPEEVNAAVTAARAALPGWRAVPNSQRRDLMLKLTDLIRADAERLATIAALENGTTRLGFLHGQIHMICDWFTYYSGWADKLDGSFSGGTGSGPFDFVIPEPHGVIAIILPWNGPLGSLAMKVAPALAAANTVVIKPPESAPYLAIRFGELAREAGFPDGVVNILVGGPQAGDALVRHPDVQKISFTGSPVTARHIIAASAKAITPTVFELGGKSASLVFPDADLDAAAQYAATLPFLNAGQICICPSRLIVHAAIYDEFLSKVAVIAKAMRVGDPLDEATGMGPMFSKAGRDRVFDHVKRALARSGVELITGGKRGEGSLSSGWFIDPTIIADPDPMSELSQTELFGPVVAVHRFESEEDAVRIANGTEYGLAAYIQTRDVDRALRLSRAINSGGIYINGSYPVANPNLAFGGIGASGFGREGGRAGLEEFVRLKSVSVNVRAQ
jgi:aldehyde dehydrogenase (NAD+)